MIIVYLYASTDGQINTSVLTKTVKKLRIIKIITIIIYVDHYKQRGDHAKAPVINWSLFFLLTRRFASIHVAPQYFGVAIASRPPSLPRRHKTPLYKWHSIVFSITHYNRAIRTYRMVKSDVAEFD